jgi:hypothetical protein
MRRRFFVGSSSVFVGARRSDDLEAAYATRRPNTGRPRKSTVGREVEEMGFNWDGVLQF